MTAIRVQAALGTRLRLSLPRLGDYLELTKPRITALVLVTAAAGFYLGSLGAVEWGLLLHTLLGTALVAAGTSAMNQVLEREVDGRMARTRGRPLPAGRLAPRSAGVFAGALAAAGVLYLFLAVNLPTALLAAAAFLVYDLAYTPLKRIHSLATLVGAIPGALPIAGGWVAARGELGGEAWALFGILFFWQLPHFLALAWLLREDYRRAGLPMLSVGDPEGLSTRHQTLVYALTLLPVSLLPAAIGMAGAAYFWAALGLGILFLARAAVFSRRPAAASARRLFHASILYLPLLLLLLTLDKLP
ncbi:MAG: heme o synthase [Gemmatimonadota bacterium]